MIELKDIKKSYQMGDLSLEVLKGISLTIEDGEYVAIMGPSGSGKSTLMNILGLLDVPSSGSYLFNGKEIAHLDEDGLSLLRREEIGFIFQQFNLLPRMTAVQNVGLPLLYSQMQVEENWIQNLLSRVGLKERMHHRPNELSGGQQQRVAIARSLVNQPRMILADEPTGNLDSQSQHEILGILKELNSQGITILVVTHEEEVAREAHRIIRVRDGRIQSDIRTKDIQQSSQLKKTPSIHKRSWTDIFEYFYQGYKTLAANKIRTALSMLGILIGVAAVVAMLAIGKGAQKSIENQLSALGSNLLTIRPGAVRVAGVTQESGAANRMVFEDLEAIQLKMAFISQVSGQVNGRGQITANSKNWSTIVMGTSKSWAVMHNSDPVYGRFFTEEEDVQRARVAVIGGTLRRELFGEQTGIGEMIKINKVIFKVIGVLPEKGANNMRDQDDVIIIPLQTAMKRLLGREFLEMMEVEVDAREHVELVQDGLMQVMSDLHKIPLSQQRDAFQIRSMAEIQEAMQQSNQTMSYLLASIAAISLLVGGIGIMNIMLVSVTERTREIGLRKAIGATRIDILAQFLSESVVVSLVGGSMGILIGWWMTLALTAILGWETSVSVSSVLVSFFFSALVGIVFGVYPAKKASQLHPIDALRFE